MTSNDTTINYLIALLKVYKIKHIVASPGMQNAKFNSIVQGTPDFDCYSVVDERSAAYFATGLSYELNSPVVITCTGATASRNYLSALTEAYYRKIPIIAITFFNANHNKFNLSPQFVDRTNTQNDIKYLSIDCPRIVEEVDKQQLLVQLNAALNMAVNKSLPVHINCPSSFNFKEKKFELPNDIWKCDLYTYDLQNLEKELEKQKFGVFIGSHKRFSKAEEKAIEEFAISYDVPIFCDHSSNYNGKNKILTSQITQRIKNVIFPDLIIDLGGISGDYSLTDIFKKAKIWRVSPDGEFLCRQNRPLEKLFDCSEEYFFTMLKNKKSITHSYFSLLNKKCEELQDLPLPLSNSLICQNLAKFLPKNSSLHLSILNSFRCMNFYTLDKSIEVNCNVGGFGIDGSLSTLIGQSMVNKNKKYFGIIGDLAFFYDMNALGLRHINNNLRIILVNNNRGVEFRINPILENNLKDKVDTLIAANGHYKNGAEFWTKSCNFEYLKATSKEEFEELIYDFCNKEYQTPVLFEVYTSDIDEKESLNIIRNAQKNTTNKSTKEKDILNYMKKIFKVGM